MEVASPGTSTEITVLTPRSLDELAEVINREHRHVARVVAAGVEHAICAGEALIEAREQVPAGQWYQWIADNTEIVPVTARMYVRIARYRNIVLPAQPRSIADAYRLVRGQGQIASSVKEELRAEAKRLATEGVPYRQIAAQIGVSDSTVGTWCNPSRRRDKRQRERDKKRATRAAFRALRRERRDKAVRDRGGSVASAYSLIRKTLQEVERAKNDETNKEARRSLSTAMTHLYGAEDMVVKAVGITDSDA